MLGLIALGGNCIKSKELKRLLQQDYFSIAADSGAEHFEKLDIIPDMLVGDMDSIPYEILTKYKKSGVEVLAYNPRKNLTDSEIAVEKAIEKGCDSILFIGALGNRADHMFGNIMLSANLADRGIPVILTDGKTFFYSVTKLNSPFTYSLENAVPREDVFSLVLAIGKKSKITIKGLEYELENETVDFGTNRCISNIIPQNNNYGMPKIALVSISDGVAFFIRCKNN